MLMLSCELTRRTKTRWALSKEKRRCAELDAVNQELSQRMTVVSRHVAFLVCALMFLDYCHSCPSAQVWHLSRLHGSGFHVGVLISANVLHLTARSTSCGHTFCTGCLASWFRSQIRYKLDDYGYGRIFEDNAFPRNAEERRLLQRTLQEDMSFAEAKEWFAYRCPTCQGDVTKTPYEVHMMKEIMEFFAANVYPHLENSALGRAANAVEFAGLFVDGDLC